MTPEADKTITKYIKQNPNAMAEFSRHMMELGHDTPSKQTLQITKNLMETQDIILDKIKELKEDICSRMDKTDASNNEQYKEIITRQDYTNGSIGRLKKSQLVLRTILATVFILMAILGFMPERLYQMLKGII